MILQESHASINIEKIIQLAGSCLIEISLQSVFGYVNGFIAR